MLFPDLSISLAPSGPPEPCSRPSAMVGCPLLGPMLMNSENGASPDPSRWMRAAIRLSARGLGRVGANPSVGALVVAGSASDPYVVGQGVTNDGGRPHAEAIALALAGRRAQNARLFVTLEPCCHEGRGPACVDLIERAGLASVFIARADPDPRVSGRGIERLMKAGVDVQVGLEADFAQLYLKSHELAHCASRPYVFLKAALSADAKIATPDQAVAITSCDANRANHALRSSVDAILVGGRTARVDHPRLTCRLPGLVHLSPRPLLMTRAAKAGDWLVKEKSGNCDIAASMRALVEQGVRRLLVEGGAQVWEAFLEAGAVDECRLWQSQKVTIGNKGLAVGPRLSELLAALPRSRLGDSFRAPPSRFRLCERQKFGDDQLAILRRLD